MSTNVLFELASLEPNHFNDPALPNNAGIIQGITQSNMIKAIDIGGLVFDMGIHSITTTILGEALTAQRYFTLQGIVLDKKDSITGAPMSTNANYAVSTFPANVVDFTLPRPSSLQEIRDYPSRILYRSCDYVNPGLQTGTSPDPDELASRERQEVFNPQRHRSLRIKRRLTDDWGLYALFSVWNPGSIEGSGIWQCWISASIYYRIVW